MSVKLDPKSDKCFVLNIANGTWFTLVNTSDIKNIIGHQHTNDPITIIKSHAEKCAEAMKDWPVPSGWGEPYGGEKLKADFIDFFNFCGGFEAT